MIKYLVLFALASIVGAFFTLRASAFDPHASATTLVSGEVVAASITATGATGATGLLTLTKGATFCGFENTTPNELQITVGGAKFKRLPAGQYRGFDFGTNSGYLKATTVIGVFATTGTPASGIVEAVCSTAF